MSRPKPEFIPTPRILNAFQVACRLNKSEQWFASNHTAIERMGFPKKDKLLGGWDAEAVEAWLDKRSGVRDASSEEEQMLEAIRGQNKPAIRASMRVKGTPLLPLSTEQAARDPAVRPHFN